MSEQKQLPRFENEVHTSHVQRASLFTFPGETGRQEGAVGFLCLKSHQTHK